MNCPREEREQAEYLLVGNYGVRAVDSRGREMLEEECSIRTCFFSRILVKLLLKQ